MDKRIRSAAAAFGALGGVPCNFALEETLRGKVYSVLVLAVLLCSSGVWYLREDLLAKLRSFRNRCCRAMCRITMVQTRRCRIPSVQLHRRLDITAMDQYYRCRLLRWSGHVSCMPMDRLPRQLLTGIVAENPRPTGSPLVTWGRTLQKVLIKCGQSPSFTVWRQAAADRMFRRQMCGQFTRLCSSRWSKHG